MKKLFTFFLLFIAIILNGQDTPPTGANFKTLPTYSFKYYTPTEAVWMYKGSTYGWTNLGKSLDTLQYYRLLNNHDSLNTLQEKSYNSLDDLPDLSIYAPIDDPTFTTKITTPALNIPTSAAVNYFWKCTDAGTGAGTWASVAAAQLYKGTVDGDDGKPSGGTALIDGTGTAGWFYVCIDAGTYDYVNPNGNSITLALNDQIHYNGTIWQKVPAGASQWVTTGSDIYYNGGNVAIGTTSAARALHVVSTFPLRLERSGQNYIDFIFTGGAVTGDDMDLVFNAGNNATQGYQFNTYNGASTIHALNINYYGDVGIKTASPGYSLDVNGDIGATGGNSTQWNTAYTHSQIAGGNSVHVSTTENTQWDAAYTHSQIAGGNSVHVSTTENSNWDAAYTHSTDNTQAHSDYLLNNASDATSGTLTATNFILSSDRRLKENISHIKNISKFDGIEFIQFNLKTEPVQIRYGVIAENVEKIAPELVRTDSIGIKSVAYIDLLIAKVAELEYRVKELEKANERQIKRDWWFYKKCKRHEN